MLGQPDENKHTNDDLAFTDGDFVRGARRVVADRAALYELASKADQLKQDVTVVRVRRDAANGGNPTDLLLVDAAQIGSAAGWVVYLNDRLKQPALQQYVRVDLRGLTAFSLLAEHLNQAVYFNTGQAIPVTLPPLTLANVPATIWLCNGGTNPLTVRGEEAQASGYVDTICVLQPGDTLRCDVAQVERGGGPQGLIQVPIYVLTSHSQSSGAGVVDAYTKVQSDTQLAAVRTTLALTPTRTADYTLQLSDAGCLVPVASSSAVTVTVPAHADVPFPVGTVLYVSQFGSGPVTLAAGAYAVAVNTAQGYLIAGQWEEVVLHKVDLNSWVLKGGVY